MEYGCLRRPLKGNPLDPGGEIRAPRFTEESRPLHRLRRVGPERAPLSRDFGLDIKVGPSRVRLSDTSS